MTEAATAASVVAELRALGSEAGRAGMARFGINADRALGVSMAAMRPLEKRLRRNHALAAVFGPPASTKRASSRPSSTIPGR